MCLNRLKHDLIKWCSVELNLNMLGSNKNPLFLGDFFVLGDLSGVIRKDIGWDYGKIWAKFEIMPKNRVFSEDFLMVCLKWVDDGRMLRKR